MERILGECEYKENKSVLQEGFWKICELFFLFVVVVVGGDFLPIRVGLGLRVGVLAVKCRRRARRRRRVGGSRGGPFRDEWEPSTARERLVCVLENPFCGSGFFRKEFISFVIYCRSCCKKKNKKKIAARRNWHGMNTMGCS